MAKMLEVSNPFLAVYEVDGKLRCMIHPSGSADSYMAYGLIVADIVRHVAIAFRVDEEAVWRWVEKERKNPTTAIKEID